MERLRRLLFVFAEGSEVHTAVGDREIETEKDKEKGLRSHVLINVH